VGEGLQQRAAAPPVYGNIYLTDESWESIPFIDKKTSQKKVDKQNGKQWK
jgi:hypothetical protein